MTYNALRCLGEIIKNGGKTSSKRCDVPEYWCTDMQNQQLPFCAMSSCVEGCKCQKLRQQGLWGVESFKTHDRLKNNVNSEGIHHRKATHESLPWLKNGKVCTSRNTQPSKALIKWKNTEEEEVLWNREEPSKMEEVCRGQQRSAQPSTVAFVPSGGDRVTRKKGGGGRKRNRDEKRHEEQIKTNKAVKWARVHLLLFPSQALTPPIWQPHPPLPASAAQEVCCRGRGGGCRGNRCPLSVFFPSFVSLYSSPSIATFSTMSCRGIAHFSPVLRPFSPALTQHHLLPFQTT